jgi:hypothetical protein
MHIFLKTWNYLLIALALGGVFQPALAQPTSQPSLLSSTLMPYAPIKRPFRLEHRDDIRWVLPAPYPTFGILLHSNGSLLDENSGEANWIVVDFGKRTIAHLTTKRDAKNGNTHYDIIKKALRHLTVEETNEIIEQANTIWNPGPDSHGYGFAVDDFSEMVLLDRNDAVVITAADQRPLFNTIEGLKIQDVKN